jgi:DNA-binding response OmpR family regulator
MSGLILVVEDDRLVSDVVCRYLEHAGYRVLHTADGGEALTHAAEKQPDLVILDLMLPSMDGREVCRILRERSAVPIIMLTALGEEADRIAGLQLGADDYVTKPFSPRELTLRVGSVLRRIPSVAPCAPELIDADLTLNLTARTALRDGVDLSLTTREFDLLAFFLTHPGTAFGRTDLLAKVWSWDFGDQSTVTVHVRRLREKIEANPAKPTRIATVWGVGYRYDSEA